MNNRIHDEQMRALDVDSVASEAFGLIKRWASESAKDNWRDRIGVPTGFHNIDMHIRGLCSGDLMLVTGAPGVGKTSFALNLAAKTAGLGASVLLVSLEASAAMSLIRMCAGDARVKLDKVLRGRLSKSDWCSIVDAFARLGELDLRICDDPRLTLDTLRTDLQMLDEKANASLVIIDGIELATEIDGGQTTRACIRGRAIELKRLAREMGVPIVATVDYGPGFRHRVKDYEGVLKALPNGVEGVADSIIHIERNPALKDSRKAPSQGLAEVIIAKSRACMPAKTRLAFVSGYQRFMDYVDV